MLMVLRSLKINDAVVSPVIHKSIFLLNVATLAQLLFLFCNEIVKGVFCNHLPPPYHLPCLSHNHARQS